VRTLTHWIGTDVGLVRTHNEDAFLWLGPDETADHGWLWVVADGMGGESAGDVASALVISAFRDLWADAIDELGTPYPAFERVLQEANRSILATTETYPDLRGMGTTVAALAIFDGKAWVAHVGDSRVYWLHNGRLEALTRDHTHVEALIAKGGLTREQAESRADASALTRAVGRPKLEVDYGTMRPLPVVDETFLLCTDGVWSHAEAPHMQAALQNLPARDAVEAVVELARRGWSDDNLTAAVVRMKPPTLSRYATRDAFLEWAAGSESDLADSGTLVLQRPDPSQGELPPRTNVQHIPRVHAAEREREAAPDPIASTSLYSPDQVAKWREAAAGAGAGASATGASATGSSGDARAAAPAADEAAFGTGTMAFSPVDMQKIRRDAAAASAGAAAPSSAAPTAPNPPSGDDTAVHPSPGERTAEASLDLPTQTMGFSLADIRAAEAAGASLTAAASAGATPAAATPATPKPDPGPKHTPAGIGATLKKPAAPASGNASTLFFSPDAAADLRAKAQQKSGSRSRERTVQLSADEAAAMRRNAGRNRTVVLSAEEIDAMADEPMWPRPKRWPWVAAFIAFVGIGAALAWWLDTRNDRAGAEASDAAAEGSGDATTGDVPGARIVMPPPPAAEPRPPDGVHEGDGMPFYRVALDDGDRVLQVDAHEVLVGQMTRVRQSVPDMDLVYRASTVALYEHMPCEGVHLASADADSRRPACVAAEAAEAYCNAMGRRLPTPDDWTAIVAASAPAIQPSRGQLWIGRDDGPPPEVPERYAAIQGVYDGLPEVLRGTDEVIARGDLPLLMQADADGAFVEVREGLLTALRRRTVAMDELPLVGFRCVADEPVVVAAAPTPAPTPAPSGGGGSTASPASSNTGAPPSDRPTRTPRPDRGDIAAAPTPTPDPPRRPSPRPGRDEGVAGTADLAREARDARAMDTGSAPSAATPTDTGDDDTAPRIQLMDPVYLPSTIDEYEAQLEADP